MLPHLWTSRRPLSQFVSSIRCLSNGITWGVSTVAVLTLFVAMNAVLIAEEPAKEEAAKVQAPSAPGDSAATSKDESNPKGGDAKVPASNMVEEEDRIEAEVAAGHSLHGETFNEGPRQRAVLLGGTGKVDFPCTCSSQEVQQFIDQGLGQLYGFWYFEAERSFRQASALDPECAMAYWGMAQANGGNVKRAKGFIEEAVKRKEKATRREQMYIDALKAYLDKDGSKDKDADKNRAQALVKAYENIIHEFPNDVEAKAFLGLQLYNNRGKGLPISSYFAVDALLNDVLEVNPMHPCHHFRIHLWDYEKPERALNSAADCGPSAPGIAHMWHMPGHIYSRLKRYDDAAWQQEASARVDHARMMADGLLPDQIHNFAHNNEWLIRDLIFIGRGKDALDLAKNMIDLPRHPKYNTLTKSGSANYGRMRLIQVIEEFELWEDLIALNGTRYWEPAEKESDQLKRQRLLGRANFLSGHPESGVDILNEFKQQRTKLEAERDAALAKAEQTTRDAEAKKSQPTVKPQGDAAKAVSEKVASEGVDAAKSESAKSDPPKVEESKREESKPDESKSEGAKVDESKKPEPIKGDDADKKLKEEIAKAQKKVRDEYNGKLGPLGQAIRELEGHRLRSEQKWEECLKAYSEAGTMPTRLMAIAQIEAGHADKGIELVNKAVQRGANQVLPLADQIVVLWRAEKKEEAKKAFEALRKLSASIDIELPRLAELAPIAEALEYGSDWRLPATPASDLGERPPLDSLGPFRWQPVPAIGWKLVDSKGAEHQLQSYRGRPVVVIFYLGYGCLHCAEQLQKFAPMAADFNRRGVDLIAISTDSVKDLKLSHENYKDGIFPFPLVSDAEMKVFKQYRCFDDFENKPLHGTFLIDAEGAIRWRDVSYEPFMDPKFLLDEATRLLDLKEAMVVEEPKVKQPETQPASPPMVVPS